MYKSNEISLVVASEYDLDFSIIFFFEFQRKLKSCRKNFYY